MNSLIRISHRLLLKSKGAVTGALFAIALPTMLMVVLLVVKDQTEGALKKDAGTFDLVVGAKGGAMQLVLSSLYHLGMPTGNILYTDYESIRADKRVREAVPIGLGDNYNGYRIVGTEPSFFTLKGRQGEVLFPLLEGRAITKKGFDAVIGAQVAAEAGMSLGSTFHGTHGLLKVPGAETHTDFTYTVVGILDRLGNAHDRAIYVPIEAVWKVHHAETSVHQVFKGGVPVKKEVTAVLVQLESAGSRLWVLDEYKKKAHLMAAVPINEVLSLSRIYLDPFQKLLLLITIGVVMVTCIVILLSIYQSQQKRRPSLLVMRSLGATRAELVKISLYELSVIITLGVLSGWFLGHLAVHFLANQVYMKTGMILQAWSIVPGEWVILTAMPALLFVVGLIPVSSIYRRIAI